MYGRNGEHIAPIGRIETATPTVTLASPLYRARTVATGKQGSVYEVRTGDDGTVTEVYALFTSGMSMNESAMTSPGWRKVGEGDTVTLTHRVEHRIYFHEHSDYRSCTSDDCRHEVIDNEWAGARPAKEWMGSKGWTTGAFDGDNGGVTITEVRIPITDSTYDNVERRKILVWY